MRKDFGVKPLTYPQPVYMIGTYDENGVPDVMNAAWGGISNDTEISLLPGPVPQNCGQPEENRSLYREYGYDGSAGGL